MELSMGTTIKVLYERHNKRNYNKEFNEKCDDIVASIITGYNEMYDEETSIIPSYLSKIEIVFDKKYDSDSIVIIDESDKYKGGKYTVEDGESDYLKIRFIVDDELINYTIDELNEYFKEELKTVISKMKKVVRF